MSVSRKRFSTLSALIGAGLMAVVMTIAHAEDADAPRAKGAKERRAQRYAKLIESFQGDKRSVYEEYGFPSYRYRERDTRGVRETWVYITEDLEFVFVGDELTRRY